MKAEPVERLQLQGHTMYNSIKLKTEVTELSGKTAFIIKSLKNASLPPTDMMALNNFSVKMTKMRRAARAVSEVCNTQQSRLQHLNKAVIETPGSDLKLLERIEKLNIIQKQIAIILYGDRSLSSREFAVPPGLLSRIETTMDNFWEATGAVPVSAEKNYSQAAEILEKLLSDVKNMESELKKLEEELFKLGAPYTQGSDFIPDWKRE